MTKIRNIKAWKATKQFFSRPVPCALLVLAGWFVLQLFSQVVWLVPEIFLGDAMRYIEPVSDIVLMILYVRWIQKKLGSDFAIGFRFDNLGQGIAMCVLVAVPIIVYNLLDSVKIFCTTPMHLSPVEFCLALLEQVLCGLRPGITEEFLCRVLLMGIIMHLTLGKKHRLALAVGISSCIFGVLHLINILNGAPVVITLYQVFYASAIGLLFGAVYARTRNILATMLFHSLIDMACNCHVNFYPELASAGEAVAQVPSTSDIAVFLPTAILCLIIGFYLLRQSRHSEIEKHWGSLTAVEAEPEEVSAV